MCTLKVFLSLLPTISLLPTDISILRKPGPFLECSFLWTRWPCTHFETSRGFWFVRQACFRQDGFWLDFFTCSGGCAIIFSLVGWNYLNRAYTRSVNTSTEIHDKNNNKKGHNRSTRSHLAFICDCFSRIVSNPRGGKWRPFKADVCGGVCTQNEVELTSHARFKPPIGTRILVISTIPLCTYPSFHLFLIPLGRRVVTRSV